MNEVGSISINQQMQSNHSCSNGLTSQSKSVPLGGGGGVLPYMGSIGMCGPKGYGFSAVLVRNRVSLLADFGHFGHKSGAPNDRFLSNAFRCCFRLSGVLLKLRWLILACTKKLLSVRIF